MEQLGSTTVMTGESRNKVAELRYKPWGEVRDGYQTTPTDYTYAGQYSNVSALGHKKSPPLGGLFVM